MIVKSSRGFVTSCSEEVCAGGGAVSEHLLGGRGGGGGGGGRPGHLPQHGRHPGHAPEQGRHAGASPDLIIMLVNHKYCLKKMEQNIKLGGNR